MLGKTINIILNTSGQSKMFNFFNTLFEFFFIMLIVFIFIILNSVKLFFSARN